MPAVIVPVGMMLGEYFHPESIEHGPQHWHVSIGGYAEHLTADEVKVWAAAMLDPPKQADLEGTRQALQESLPTVTRGAITNPDPIINDLLDRGLLVEFDPLDGDIETFARSYRLFPLGIGLGNSGDDPLIYHIAVASEPRVGVNGDVYALWSNSLYYLNLWESCQQFVKEMTTGPPGDHAFDLDPEIVTRELTANIPLLVSSECAFLDPVPHAPVDRQEQP